MVETTKQYKTEQYNTPNARRIAEIAAFEPVRDAVQVAQYRIGVLSADIERHLLTLHKDIRIRTAERQATLSLEDIEKVTDDLVKARDALLVVLMKAGEADPSPNDEKAKRVIEILDKMEAGGEFEGLTDDEKAVERQTLGMRLRADMDVVET